MRFEVKTLVDITPTHARFNKSDTKWHQQQNFMTFLQTIELRVNLIVEKEPVVEELDLKDLEFGSNYKGKQNVWTFKFIIEYQDAIDVKTLENDFDLIPIIINLDETVKLKNAVISTKDNKTKNTIFSLIE